MTLQFDIENFVHNPELLVNKALTFEAFPDNTNGTKSEIITFSIDVRNPSIEEQDAYVRVTLNRNNARYIMNFLKSFLEEEKIDTDAY